MKNDFKPAPSNPQGDPYDTVEYGLFINHSLPDESFDSFIERMIEEHGQYWLSKYTRRTKDKITTI